MEALEENGVLVFRELHIDDDTQVAFSKRLDDVGKAEPAAPPRIFNVTLDPTKSATADVPAGDGLLAHRRRAGRRPHQGHDAQRARDLRHGGRDGVRQHVRRLRRPHRRPRRSSTRTSACSIPSRPRSAWSTPTPRPSSWRAGGRSPTRSTRSSGGTGPAGAPWCIGASASHVVGMDLAEGKALLDELLERSTAPERVYRHEWAVGDLVIWDNTGVMHRVHPYDPASGREMHRTTMSGDEPIR